MISQDPDTFLRTAIFYCTLLWNQAKAQWRRAP